MLHVLRGDRSAGMFAAVKLANLEAALNKRPFRAFELRVDGEVIVLQRAECALFASTSLEPIAAREFLGTSRGGRPHQASVAWLGFERTSIIL